MKYTLILFSLFLAVLALDREEPAALVLLQQRADRFLPDEVTSQNNTDLSNASIASNEVPASHLAATEVSNQTDPLAFSQAVSGIISDGSTNNSSAPVVPNVTVGNTVDLTEEGYNQTAALHNEDEMRAFMLRVLHADGYTKALNEASFTGMIPFYDGIEANQSLAAMRKEFAEADWVYPPNRPVSGNITNLTENGYLQVAALNSTEDMKAFARRILLADGRALAGDNETSFTGVILFYDGSGPNCTQSLQALKDELARQDWVYPGIGRVAPLSEEGYRKVAYTHDLLQMNHFARRVLNETEGGEIKLDRATTDRILPYFDGETDMQDFEALQTVFTSPTQYAGYGPAGNTSLLMWWGYFEVQGLQSDKEMEAYTRRILHRDGRSVRNETGLKEFIPFYSGTKEKRKWNPFLKALREADWVNPGLGRTAPLSEEGYQSVAAHPQNDVQMKSFARRLLAEHGKPLFDDTQLEPLTQFFDGRESMQDFDSFVEALVDLPDSPPEDFKPKRKFAKWANIDKLV